MTGRAAMLVATALGVSAAALPLAIDPSPWFVWNASATAMAARYPFGKAVASSPKATSSS